ALPRRGGAGPAGSRDARSALARMKFPADNSLRPAANRHHHSFGGHRSMKLHLGLALAVLVAVGALATVPAAEPQNVTITVSDDHIDFLAGKDLVGRYNKGPNVAKPYMWPLNGPGGVAMTRAWPMVKGQPGESTDHIHQKSFWFCHGDVIPEGLDLKTRSADKTIRGVDFWSENKGAGKIVCTRVEAPKMEKNHGQVTTQNEWRTPEGQKILDEKRTIHFHDFGDARLIVFDIDLHASVCPIVFGDTKEGSFGIRINDAIREEMTVDKKRTKGPGKLENAEGKVGEKDCWGYISNWCDYSG